MIKKKSTALRRHTKKPPCYPDACRLLRSSEAGDTAHQELLNHVDGDGPVAPGTVWTAEPIRLANQLTFWLFRGELHDEATKKSFRSSRESQPNLVITAILRNTAAKTGS